MNPETTRILLVEDDPADARLVQTLLTEVEPARFRVKLVFSLQAALTTLKAEEFHVILLDLSLPDANGLDALHKIAHSKPSIPIVVLSAVHDESLLLGAIEAGAQDYMVKGHGDGNDIARIVRYAIERKQAEVRQRNQEKILAEAERIAHIGSWVWDLKHAECHWSDEIYKLFGYAPQSFGPSYEKLLELVYAEDRDKLAQAIQNAMAGGKSYRVDHRVVRADGTVRIIHNSGEIEFDNTSNPRRLLGILQDKTEHVRAQQALRASQAHLRLIVDSAGEGIFGVDLAGSCTFANPACVRMLGYASDSELIGKHMHTLTHHTRRDGTHCPPNQCKVYNVFNTGRGCHVDDEIMWRKDGSSFDVEYRASPLMIDGNPAGAVAIFSDITRRKLFEAALRESEERFRGAFNSAAHGMALVSTDGHFLKVNQSLCNIVGYKNDELLRTDFQTITHPDDLDKDLELVNSLLRGEKDTYQLEKRYLHKNGKVVWILLSVSLVKDAEGTPLHFVSQIQDISKAKQAEEELRRAHEELEQRVIQRTAHLKDEIFHRKRAEEILRHERDFSSALLDTLGALVVVLDRNARIIRFNRACEDITGYAFEEIEGRMIWDFLLDPDEIETVKGVFQQLRIGLFPNRHVNYWLTRDGQKRLISWSNTALQNTSGNVEYIIGTGIDITEQQRIEELEHQHLAELAHVSRLSLMGEMATEIAHELNQPLTSIANYGSACLRMLKAEASPNPDYEYALTGIIEQANRAAEVIRRLRGFVAKGELRKATTDLNDLIIDVIKLAEPDVREHAINIQLKLAKQLPNVHVDHILIEQVILNLIRNAIEAMSKHDDSSNRITIITQYNNDDVVEVTVQDSGPGIKPEVIENLFTPFFTTKASGIGMGLPICKSIIEDHKGKIWFDNTYTQGASFHFTLPLPQDSKP